MNRIYRIVNIPSKEYSVVEKEARFFYAALYSNNARTLTVDPA